MKLGSPPRIITSSSWSIRTASSICGKSRGRLSVMTPCVPCCATGSPLSCDVLIDWTWKTRSAPGSQRS
jgi:hypothetical protein